MRQFLSAVVVLLLSVKATEYVFGVCIVHTTEEEDGDEGLYSTRPARVCGDKRWKSCLVRREQKETAKSTQKPFLAGL
jgi:hypothetical protein